MLTKLAVTGIVISFLANVALTATYQPVNVRPILAEKAPCPPITIPTVEIASEQPAVAELHAPSLDGNANRPHNANKVMRGGRTTKTMCGPMRAMAGAPHGKQDASYGRVSRCEEM